ncbi:hypothetical protein DAPPUDRAFT_301431 [Daphnia pulex]|uniref:Uncharacterized protein n=1 Tax=Daphnia pulex TaxID=6669 RepID=E9HIA1_DAPPU|nr:hypothetical protein DAPPUDRAFT_301431 [Daphnia pulex]|eukprot:EFX68546.1 hypothetical protein DAPPUDRAFT_301431 [Daphnia pulex]
MFNDTHIPQDAVTDFMKDTTVPEGTMQNTVDEHINTLVNQLTIRIHLPAKQSLVLRIKNIEK